MPKPIVWIASYPKSGNTWLRMLLHAWNNGGHVNINAPGCTVGDRNPYLWQAVAAKPLNNCTPTELSHIRPAMLVHLLAMFPQRPLFVKTHHAYSELDGIPVIPPSMTAMAWYVARDPRDVAVSCARHFKLSVDDVIDRMNDKTYQITDEGTAISHYLSTWSLHAKSWLEPKPFPVKLVKYETLLEKPGETFSRLLESAGIFPKVDRVARCIEACRFGRLKEQEREGGFHEAPRDCEAFFRKGTAGQWRNELTPEQARRIESNHSEMMSRLGYLSTATAKSPKTKAA